MHFRTIFFYYVGFCRVFFFLFLTHVLDIGPVLAQNFLQLFFRRNIFNVPYDKIPKNIHCCY
jgi:hypothetical protein